MRTKLKIIKANLSDYFIKNQKLIICFSICFILGLAVGVIATICKFDNSFEKVQYNDINFGGGKVFLICWLKITVGYAIILTSSYGRKLGFISIFSFIGVGILLGRDATLLCACFGFSGAINLIIIYLPFSLFTFLLLLICAVKLLSNVSCDTSCKSILRPSFWTLLKIYALNIVVCFTFFIFVGLFTKVIIIPR